MYKNLFIIVIFGLLFFAAPLLAQQPVPLLINFQGKLTDSNQAPVDGLADVLPPARKSTKPTGLEEDHFSIRANSPIALR